MLTFLTCSHFCLMLSLVICGNESLRSSLTNLFKDYDRNKRPSFGTSDADRCKFEVFIYQIGPVSEASMSLTTDLYIRQIWQDKRVNAAVSSVFESMPPSNKSRFISLTNDMASRLWRPNVYFKDAVKESTPKEFSKSQFLRVYENGTILSSKRVLLTTRCEISLKFFPLDQQLCHICIESYELDDSEQIITWAVKEMGLTLTQSTATFDVDNHVELTTHTRFYEDLDTHYTTLCMEVRLARKLTMYIVTMYLPSVALVILSWVSFWIDKKAVPARAGLTITTILAQITLITGTANKFPGIADLKLGDTYMIVNFFFVFGSLIEFAMVSGQEQQRMRATEVTEERKQLTENKNKAEDDENRPAVLKNVKKNIFQQVVYKKFNGDIDAFARRLFPICFGVWNILYFLLGLVFRGY